MNVFNKISKIEALKLKVPVLFNEDNLKANNYYGIISDGIYTFQFSWNSEIKPAIKEVDKNVYSIGIDQHFAIIDFNYNRILLNLNLFYNFYNIKEINEWLFVITELEIIKIDKITFKVLGTFDLPDFFEGIEFKNGVIEIKCSGDEIVIIK